MIPRCTIGKGVTGAVRYILSEGRDPESGRRKPPPASGKGRVAWFGGVNFGFDIASRDDADLARRVMEFDAQNQSSRTRQCEKDCVHLSLGWRPGETPSVDEMQRAANEALAALGMENARALFAVHSDEHYSHIHIVASKINPATGRAYDLRENYLKLSRWAQQHERDHGGVVCPGREEANEMRDAIRDRAAAAVLALITKQRATFSAHELDRVLAKEIHHQPTRAEFSQVILALPGIVRLSEEPDLPPTRFTTRTVLDAENRVLSAAGSLAAATGHDIGNGARRSTHRHSRFSSMTAEQVTAFGAATGKSGLALIDGKAGTGKSFTLSAIRQAYEACGRQVVGLGPTNAVAQDMKRDGFATAATIHSQIFALKNGRTSWGPRTVVILDEAAMVDTKLMAEVAHHANQAGAKLILVGDDRQLSSIDHGGMFGALKDRYGAASLTEVRRQTKNDDRRATELMAEGNFHGALDRYDAKGAIHWTNSQDEARAALVRRWSEDTARDPGRSRFVFAYTNLDVDELNRDLRRVREQRGELGAPTAFETKHGRFAFAAGDRLQFSGTDKKQGIFNGNAGVVEAIDGTWMTVRLDGETSRRVIFDAAGFQDFRHGYAGTIYKGQGRTIDQTYLYHSEHWRSAASYVALSRHREKAELFVSRDTARDVRQLARQMGRVEERRAASKFYRYGEGKRRTASERPPESGGPRQSGRRYYAPLRGLGPELARGRDALRQLWRKVADWMTGPVIAPHRPKRPRKLGAKVPTRGS